MQTPTFADVVDFLLRHSDRLRCYGCWRTLEEIRCWSVEKYPHEHGVFLRDLNGCFWIYVHCGECGYDTALWKLVKQLEVKRKYVLQAV